MHLGSGEEVEGDKGKWEVGVSGERWGMVVIVVRREMAVCS